MGYGFIFDFLYVKTKNKIFTFAFIIETNIQCHYLEEITEW